MCSRACSKHVGFTLATMPGLPNHCLDLPQRLSQGQSGWWTPLSESFPAALPALTQLRLSCSHDVDVSGLTGLRRLGVRAEEIEHYADYFSEESTWAPSYPAIKGLSRLTALEDLRLDCERGPLAQPSDLAPLTALTRLAMTSVPRELGSHPVAARLRRLDLQSFGVLEDAPGGGDGSGANGAAAAALAALARGAPLLEHLRILDSRPRQVDLGAPLGPGVAWPSLTHLHVTSWALLLLAGCAFPRLARLAACVAEEARRDEGIDEGANERLRAAVAALAAKARDDVTLRVASASVLRLPTGVLSAEAAVPGLRNLSWMWWNRDSRDPAPQPGDWARLAASLESLDLSGPLAAVGYAEPLAALTCLTRLFLEASLICLPDDTAAAAQPPLPPAGGACESRGPCAARAQLARVARALAMLPRLAHLRLTFPKDYKVYDCTSDWACPAVAAELARCRALRLLEIGRRDDPIWRHERLYPADGLRLCVPRPSPAWPPFAEALRAGGCGATVRPAPAASDSIAEEFEPEF
jgi:hypothetical protein